METKEKNFEDEITNYLCSAEGGYIIGNAKNFNRELSMDTETLLKFIKTTQTKEFEKFSHRISENAEDYFIKKFCAWIEEKNILDALRNPFEIRGCKFRLVWWKPATNINSESVELYNKNILTCVRQLHYSTKNENSLDIVLFVNGLPLVTMELKNQFTDQNFQDAIHQYKNDRDPHEKIFQFGKRTLVHFAVDLTEVAMTTKLEGEGTFFIPFNQGSNGAGKVGGAGNPRNTDYLWKKVLCKDIFLEILQKYLLFDKEKNQMIFPRYHQLDAVTKILNHVAENGAGQNYLIQHSAGSGKSNTIAWLAHRLTGLHDPSDEIIFNSVIVVTDRKVLDNQLQNTVYQFERVGGVVEKIDRDSAQLRDAINSGKKIIITTLQKFPVIFKEVRTGKKKFAVIVDEAHSSQTGDSAKKLKISLTDVKARLEEFAKIEGAEENKRSETEEKIFEELATQGKQPNLSFFAFTATPKAKTLQIFGNPNKSGEFEPFHIYSMRQAIEEGFIWDVLANYVTYQTYFQIGKITEFNPDVDKGKAVSAIKNFAMLHPHNITEKTKIIMEHFVKVTHKKIGGRAKAMIVTASRLHAVKYFFAVKKYISENKLSDINALVAFSGELVDDEKTYTETKLNGISEKSLPAEFHSAKYNILIVAEKYQTGFDEPLLHTMFVDKKLDGVKAVQTLSRLNRTAEGKEDTFILDFANDAENIRKSFQPFYERSILSEGIDFDMLYKLKNALDDYKIYSNSDIESVCKLYYQSENMEKENMSRLVYLLKPPRDKFLAVENETDRENFKSLLAKFHRLYLFLTQINRNFDADLFKFHIFSHLLYKILPKRKGDSIYITDLLTLEFYKLKQNFSGSIELKSDDNQKISPIIDSEGIVKKNLKNPLTKIIQEINLKFGTDFSNSDKVFEEILFNFSSDKKAVKCAKENDANMFRTAYQYDKHFEDIFYNLQDSKFINFILNHIEILQTLKEEMFYHVYKALRKS